MIDIDGEPWFVATDVCKALDIHVNAAGKPNVTAALKKLKPQQIGFYRIETKARGGSTRQQQVKVISEGGLYKLIMRSDKAEADAFQDWVTEVVLPAIRKDGGYIAGQVLGTTIAEPELLRGPLWGDYKLKLSLRCTPSDLLYLFRIRSLWGVRGASGDTAEAIYPIGVAIA